ncbi:MAG: hypothetical protein R3C49_08725 [Planctomycetaceae bacterium]
MAEWRCDPLTGSRILLATSRAGRPVHLGTSSDFPWDSAESRADDPFLEGHEHDTPDERLALRRAGSEVNSTGWLLRVVPNRFPAVLAHSPCPLPEDVSMDRIFQTRTAVGIHDVVIECPDGRSRLVDCSVTEVARILTAWQKRAEVIDRDRTMQSLAVFRNEGAFAGASLPHCHSQILAHNECDELLLRRLQRIDEWREARGGSGICLYQSWLQAEQRMGIRIVRTQDDVAVVCPFASQVSRQVRFCPMNQRCGDAQPFFELSENAVLTLAALLLSVIQTLARQLGGFSFNLTLTLPPVGQSERFPWMLDVLPRTSQFAGFELLSRSEIVTHAPEETAAWLTEQTNWLAATAVDPICPEGWQWR